ncbi:MAG: hypothetical protein IPP63_18690 [Chloracidobacterium sp.]|nr:hypothetical protein [Chloracidobacterium sp.]
MAFRTEDFAGRVPHLIVPIPKNAMRRHSFILRTAFTGKVGAGFRMTMLFFSQGLPAANRVVSIDPNFRSSDAALGLKTAIELKLEFDEGLKLTPSDLNPLKLMRERK